MAFSAASSAFARAAFLPVKAAGISSNVPPLRRATGTSRAPCAGAALSAAAADVRGGVGAVVSRARVEPPGERPASEDPPVQPHVDEFRARLGRLLVRRRPQGVFHGPFHLRPQRLDPLAPFFREFCNTSLARYRKLSLRFPGAARSSFCHTGASVFARLRWNTHQCDRVSMLCGKAGKALGKTRGQLGRRRLSAMSPIATCRLSGRHT